MKKTSFFLILNLVFTCSLIAQVSLSFNDLNPKNSDTMTWFIVPASVSVAPIEGGAVHQDYLNVQVSSAISTLIYKPSDGTLIPNSSRFYSDNASTGIFSIVNNNYESVANNEILWLGYETQPDSISLASITMGIHDKIIFPKKEHTFAQPPTILQFPITPQSIWQSNARMKSDFRLTILGAGYDNSNGNYIQNRNSKTTVVGWGTTSYSLNNSPSAPLIGMLLKETITETDSFLVDDYPIGDDLLAILGLQQGMSRSKVIYKFYRSGQEKPLFICRTDGNNLISSFVIDNDTTYARNLSPRLTSSVPDTLVATNKKFELNYISRHFSDGNSNDLLHFDIKQSNGDSLPDWIIYDSNSAALKGNASDSITLTLVITARDFAGDSCSDTAKLIFREGVGVNSIVRENFSVFPQPCSNQVTITSKYPINEGFSCQLTNSAGQIVKVYKLSDGMTKKQLDVSGLPTGIYYLINSKTGLSVAKVIIVQN